MYTHKKLRVLIVAMLAGCTPPEPGEEFEPRVDAGDEASARDLPEDRGDGAPEVPPPQDLGSPALDGAPDVAQEAGPDAAGTDTFDAGEAAPSDTRVADTAPLDRGPEAALDTGAMAPCAPIPGVRYGSLSIAGSVTDRPAAAHGDINLRLRTWVSVPRAVRGLIMIDGPTDDRAPRLNAMFTDDRIPAFAGVYAAQAWDWGCNCARAPMTSPEVTLAGFVTRPGEVLEAPTSGYDIGEGYLAMVLYAGADTLTLKLTREDNVVRGYTLHFAGLCVEPSLLSAYEAANRAGRRSLPAVRPNQPVGRALGAEVFVAVRDTGAWMDPRSRKDWWPR
jgi:hypothetical protein